MKNKNNPQRQQTKRIAAASIFSALSVIILSLGSVIEVMDLTLCAIASVFVVLSVIELGYYWPFLVYAVTGILSALLLPNKFPAVVYLLFAGLYPMFKAAFERLHYVIGWLLKFSFFNTTLLLIIFITVYVMRLEDTGLEYTVILLLLANVTFFLYDFVLTKLITLYLIKLRRLFGFKNYFDND